ncbi:response regulator [Undibacterium flavidum]|uniref:Response regulator n=1 Tax=Undibacterium flavidum TaxID=2762297 RepID=A0ABR6YEA7_9BURK|nr:response regulator [Undibacterium flavidum]MBC3874849.1 response regulator [Undibacterium flavidum]
MTQNTFEFEDAGANDASKKPSELDLEMNAQPSTELNVNAQVDDEVTRHPDLVYVYSDSVSYAHELADALSIYGHEVLGFSDLDEFRSAILVRAPSAAVLDIDASGGRLAKDSMAARVITSFPVIYVSSNDNFDDRLLAVREGAEGYFIKPVDVQALSVRVDEKIAQNTIRSYRILVVDDDEFFLSFFDAVLSSAGMHVKGLIDPTQILESIKKFKPELILTDLYMPQCNGIEMAKVVRQNNHYIDIPIVFLSSETEMQKQLGALETGADEFLTKPIDPEKLISSVATRAERYRNLRKNA